MYYTLNGVVTKVPLPMMVKTICQQSGCTWMSWQGGNIIYVKDDGNPANASTYAVCIQQVADMHHLPISGIMLELLEDYRYVHDRKATIRCSPPNEAALRRALLETQLWFNGDPIGHQFQLLAGILSEEVESLLNLVVAPEFNVRFSVKLLA